MSFLAIFPDTGLMKIQQVAGADETGAGVDITVAGMLATDGIYAVFMCDAAYTMTEMRPLNDFTCGAGVLTVVAHATDRTGEFYVIFWKDVT